jgi:hypothetical protein
MSMKSYIFDVPTPAASEDSAEKMEVANDMGRGRQNDRQSIFMHGDVQLEHMPAPQRARIRNLSKGGAMVETPLPGRLNEEVVVKLPNIGPVRGRVAWAVEGRFGVEFFEAVDPHQVRRKIVVTKEEPELFGLPKQEGRGRPGFTRG